MTGVKSSWVIARTGLHYASYAAKGMGRLAYRELSTANGMVTGAARAGDPFRGGMHD